MKDYLIKKQKMLAEKKASLQARSAKSEDLAEVRSITAQIEDINAELRMIEESLAEYEKKEAEVVMRGADIPAQAQKVNGAVVGQYEAKAQTRSDEHPLESLEYRKAFMAYVQKGTPIPAEFRNGATISTEESGAAIPLTIINDVINTVRKKYGNLYSKVKKISVPGGVEIPVGQLRATFKWISESTVSPRQKFDKLGKVSFSYNTAEIRISQTFLSQLLTLSSFEAKITEVIVVAYLQAMDDGIVNGSGDGAMLGILNDPRVTNTVTMTASAINNWTKWRKDFFAQLPLGYRGGEFIFPVGTVDAYLETMADSNNNPIFRQATGLEVNDGDAVAPGGRFFGREISLVEPDIIPNFDEASQNDVIGIYWQPEEYMINENFGFTMRRYFDEETNEWVDKAIVVVDGKVVNPTGFYKIVKG